MISIIILDNYLKIVLDDNYLKIILDDYKSKDIELYGVFPPGAAGSKKLRLFIDYLKAYFVKQHTALGMLKST